MSIEHHDRHTLRAYLLVILLLAVIFSLLLAAGRGKGRGSGSGAGDGEGAASGSGHSGDPAGETVSAMQKTQTAAETVSKLPDEADAEFVPQFPAEAPPGKQGGGSGFYGIPMESDGAVLFVVDLSSSMNSRVSGGGTRLDILKEELIRTLSTAEGKRRLYGEFRILAFTGKIRFIPEDFCRYRDREAVDSMIREIRSWQAKGETDILLAWRTVLTETLRRNIKEVFFLSDGKADFERRKLEEILQALPAGVKIHYIPTGTPSPLLAELLSGKK